MTTAELKAPEADTSGRERWCVVGGGMLGMVLALRLAERGHAVTLKEAAPGLGGLASPWQLGDVTWDRFYHVILLSDSVLRGLLDELGLTNEAVWTTTRTSFYTFGNLYPLSNALDYLRFPPLGLIGKARLAATILAASRIEDGAELEKISAADWLIQQSGRAVYEEIWRPLLRAKLGDNHRDASAAFIWAVIRRLYAARRSGLKTEMFGYVRGGYGRIIQALTARLRDKGVTIELGTRVTQIEGDRIGKVRVRSNRGDALYDNVAVTVATPLAARICPTLSTTEHQRLNDIRYQGIACASLLLRRPLGEAYLTYIADETIPFTAVVEISTLVDREEFGGNTLVYLPKYLTADEPTWNESDEEIERRFLTALYRMYPNLARADVLEVKIARAREVLAVTTLNYSARLPPIVTSVPGLFLVNSAQIVNGTLNVNETLTLAESAAALLTTRARVAA